MVPSGDHGVPPPTRRDQLALAFAFLTRLPFPTPAAYPEGALARASWSFPLVGIVVGLIGAGAVWVSFHLGVPPDAGVLLGIGAAILVTGGLHEDGLADTADGFGGGNSVDGKLAIMKDSRIGTFGVLALIVAIGLKFVALADLAVAGIMSVIGALIAAHALSRGLLPGLMHLLSPARSSGLGRDAGRPTGACTYTALGLGWLIGTAMLGVTTGAMALIAGMAAMAGIGWIARRQIGGYTGDVLGAAQQVAEIAILLAASR